MDQTSTEMAAEAYIDTFHKAQLNKLVPVIVVMGIIFVLGTVGNSFTIAFYGVVARRTPTIFLITVLAIVDLFVCVFIVGPISVMAFNVKFSSPAGCNIIIFFGHWAVATSVGLLWFISIDRHRNVCCPFKRQVTYTMAKRVAIAIIVIGFLIALRYFANYDIVEFTLDDYVSNTTVALANYCTTRKDPDYKVNNIFWHSLDTAVFMTTLVTFCVTYGRIVCVLKTGGIGQDTVNKKERCNKYTANKDAKRSDVYTVQTATHDGHGCIADFGDKPEKGNSAKALHKTTAIDRSKRKTTERSITLMMMVVSLIFCACFVPYLIIGIRSYQSAHRLELGLGEQFLLRLPYVNSFANPIVFSCFNPQFRLFIKRFICRLKKEAQQ